MKKIINGRMYNTETAKEIGYFRRNIPYMLDTLYQKKTGEYFEVHNHFSNDGNYETVSEFYPISEDDAKEWVAKFMTGDKYEEIFGKVEE